MDEVREHEIGKSPMQDDSPSKAHLDKTCIPISSSFPVGLLGH
jgi:hypothetical protein